eukprot:6184709-Pleurochrysis_carterae.AAC.1
MAPRSRGMEAVQAATAAAAPTAAVAAAPANATDAANSASDKEGEIIYPLESAHPVLDMKGLCAVRLGSRDPVQPFRMFLLPEGRSVRVPNCIGKFTILDGAT